MQDGSTQPNQTTRTGRASRVLPWERLGALAGWAVVLLFIGLAFVESTGLLSRMVERRAQAVLRPLGLKSELGDSRIGWLSRSLNLSDVRVLGPGSAEELELTVSDVRLVLGFGFSTGFFLERVETKGGQFHFSESGLRRLEATQAGLLPKSTSPNPGLHVPAQVLVEGLKVEYFDGKRNWDQGSLWAENTPSDEGLLVMARWSLPKRLKELGSHPKMQAGQEILAQARIRSGAPLRIQLQAKEVDLGTTNLAPLLAHWVPAWQRDPMLGLVSLDASLGVPLSPGHRTSGNLRLKIRDAYAPLTAPGPHQQRLQHLDLDLVAGYSGRDQQDWTSRQAWRGRAQALTLWNGVDLRLQARFGAEARTDSLAELWLQTDSLEVSEDFAEGLGNPKIVTNLRSMLAPEGTIALGVGLRLPEDRGWLQEELPHLPIAVQVEAQGQMSVAYVGPPNPVHDNERDVGFPRRIDNALGKVIFIAIPGLEFSQRTGIYEVQGDVGTGSAQVSGGVWSPLLEVQERKSREETPEHLPLVASTRLAIRGQNLTFDEEMIQAFEGLRGVEGSQEVLADYAPSNGSVDLVLDFWGQRGQFSPWTRLEVRAKELGAQWRRFPIPLKDVTADVVLISDEGSRTTARGQIQFEATASTPVAHAPIRVGGHSVSVGGQSDRSWFELNAPEINLRSSALKSAIDAVDGDLRSIFEQAHLSGWLNLVLQSVQVRAGDVIQTYAEARPHGEGLSALPGAFPIETNGMQGRILARSEIEPGPQEVQTEDIRLWTQTHILGRFGSRTQPFPLSILLASQPGERATGSVAVADIDVLSPLIVGAVGQYLASDRERFQAFDPDSIPMEGRISGSCDLLFAPPDVKDSPEVDVRLELDLDRFGPEGKELLRDVKGQVRWAQETGSWTGENLTGRLGETRIELRRLTVIPGTDHTDAILDFSARDVPIDKQHLEPFLEPELLRTLISELDAKGRFDVNAGHLTLEIPDNGPPAMRLQGQVQLRDAFIRLGLPVAVEQTRRFDLDLHYEGSHVRARGTIEGLVGQVAERRMEDANFQFTYVAPRLTIEEFNGAFEGGRLQSLGEEADGPAGFFALDMEPPFRFSLSAAMAQVDVGLLLAGVFNSDFANEGRLDGELRLNGDVGHLTQVRGRGNARLSDSALWAIPVFQSLFSQLGFDTTATFKLMEAGFTVGDGRIDLRAMQIKSDLLSLLGSGWVDFEGELSQNLEVRYSLVDRLGPLTRLLYFIQNSLLRISIRGDMARPRVVLNGLFSQFIKNPKGKRQLPLPGLSELPRSF